MRPTHHRKGLLPMSSWITKLVKSKTKFLAIPALVLATGGTALALTTSSPGGTQVQMLNASAVVRPTTSSTTFVDVPGATRVVSGPSGTTRLINALFTA